ncbi:hypothetical protein [Micromonospora globbae]|uniref:hypothetical protein n=1 Tax=Micromonospora globbae TaxID=1894969 RepID=UPI001F01697A|nr:hypothetical protein [Micromonospora globbae]
MNALEARIGGNGHQPERPSWDCLSCRQPWPCPPARVKLGETYGPDRIGLGMYMGALLLAAVIEMPEPAPDDLFQRFVAWTR